MWSEVIIVPFVMWNMIKAELRTFATKDDTHSCPYTKAQLRTLRVGMNLDRKENISYWMRNNYVNICLSLWLMALAHPWMYTPI